MSEKADWNRDDKALCGEEDSPGIHHEDCAPCPFCGKEPTRRFSNTSFCLCPDDTCPGGTEWHDVIAWNRRAPPATDALLAEMREALQAARDALGAGPEQIAAAFKTIDAVLARAAPEKTP